MKLSLAIKFNLVFVAIFAIGLTAAGIVADRVLQQQALDETRHDADVLMSAAEAMQDYTAKHITPLLSTQIQYSFVPESVPAFSAIEMLNTLQGSFPDFSYRSTMLNPTNPRERATACESEVTAHLHDTPAPRTMLDKYGPANGFGWQMNQVIGAEFVSVPMSESIARGRALWRSFMEALTVVFVVVLVVLNVLVHFLVTRRLQTLSRAADAVSLGKLDDVELPTRGGDEIASLAVSFGRMRTSLVTAFESLDETG
ncbi:c-type heme family protein, partial [Burkholderia gladioli]|uniref:c-type heme family protein n=1 Tax=Burkholderia gladioli TaxID=28095 RepID=UPI00163F7C8F